MAAIKRLFSIFGRRKECAPRPHRLETWGEPSTPMSLLPRIRKHKFPYIQDPESVVQGTVSQTSIDSIYAGTQCTSISLQALCWWSNAGEKGYFDQAAIDNVIFNGHYLHKHFREVLQVSSDADNRVSIEDLPPSCNVHSGTYYRNKGREAYLSMNTNGSMGDLKTLREYLLSFTSSPFGCLVTLDEFTQAIMYNKDRKWLVFDSHGDVKFLDKNVQNASCWVFNNVDGVLAFLNKVRPNHQGYCLAAKPLILSNTIDESTDGNGSDAGLRKPVFKTATANVSTSCPGRIDTAAVLGYEEDPYVSMMGGFGGY